MLPFVKAFGGEREEEVCEERKKRERKTMNKNPKNKNTNSHFLSALLLILLLLLSSCALCVDVVREGEKRRAVSEAFSLCV